MGRERKDMILYALLQFNIRDTKSRPYLINCSQKVIALHFHALDISGHTSDRADFNMSVKGIWWGRLDHTFINAERSFQLVGIQTWNTYVVAFGL